MGSCGPVLLQPLDTGGGIAHEAQPIASIAANQNPDRFIGPALCRVALRGERLGAWESLGPDGITRDPERLGVCGPRDRSSGYERCDGASQHEPACDAPRAAKRSRVPGDRLHGSKNPAMWGRLSNPMWR